MIRKCQNVRILFNPLLLNRETCLPSLMCSFSTARDMGHEAFLKRCTDLIERRGHRFIRFGETIINSDGNPEFFDITYGWPIRYYCKCSFSDTPVHAEEIITFEAID